jgi:membrane-bound ClpP family serine protease
MSLQPDTDRRLEESSRRFTASGARLLALALILDITGIILLVTDASTVLGLFAIGLSLAPTIGAVALMGSGAVSKRASEQKDFA